jgi:heptaprenyl diphosphate synthase/octaprenyl-diphosphate synthase
VRATDFSELLQIDHLESCLDEVAAAMTVALAGTPAVVGPARRMLEAGGKRLRPLLTIASAAACDPNVSTNPLDARVRRGAVAVELVHVGSLVHDDIMDEALARRGVPTVNAVEGANQALLVGDFLLARAGVEAAHVSKEVAMSLAVTISDLCDGQSLEGVFQNITERTIDDAIESIRGKTGALMRASCDIGALCVGGVEHAPALAEFGMNFGIAFQLVDDVLDLVSTSDLMGKPVNNDVKSGVFTVPMLFALDQIDGREAAVRLMVDAVTEPAAAERFRSIVLDTDAIAATLELVTTYNRKAQESILSLPPSPTRDGLAMVPQRYLDDIVAEKTAGLGRS